MSELWKRICCPIDFSTPSREATQVAVDLSRRFNSELQLIHVFHVPVYSFLDATVFPSARTMDQLIEKIDSLLLHWEQESQRLGARKVVSAKVEGVPHVEIVEEERADMIVMGTHGHTGVKHALIGSVAEKVVRSADCPVLTIRPSEA